MQHPSTASIRDCVENMHNKLTQFSHLAAEFAKSLIKFTTQASSLTKEHFKDRNLLSIDTFNCNCITLRYS